MARGCSVAVLALAWMTSGSRAAEPPQAPAEPNLEKRARLALDESDAAFDAARSHYREGDTGGVESDAARIADSANLALLSLNQTGKDPRKSPHWFKIAEIRMRGLLRKLETLEREMDFADRPMIEKAKTEVERVHDKLLLGLLEGKPK